MNNFIILNANLDISGSVPEIHFFVKNVTHRDVFLFDVLHSGFDGNGYFVLDDVGYYAEIQQDVAQVSRKIFPVPKGVLVERVNVPFVTRLAPNSVLVSRFATALPLRFRSPYSEPVEFRGGPPVSMPLVFQLGFFVAAEGTEDLLRMFPTDGGPKYGFSPFPINSQLLITSDILGELSVYR